MPIIKGYTLYFYANKSKSRLLYLAVDGKNKADATRFGKSIAKLWESYYATFNKKIKLRVEVEVYQSKTLN
jgi:hypothetical protein